MPDTQLESSTTSVETVTDCVARLGMPPEDILNEWLDEASSLTGDDSLTSFDPDAEVWKTLRIGAGGRLSFEPERNVELLIEISRSPLQEEATDEVVSDLSSPRIRSRWILAVIIGFTLAGLGWLIMRPDRSDEVALRSETTRSETTRSETMRARSFSGNTSERSEDFASLPSTEPIESNIDTTAEPSESELELMIEDIDAFTASTPADLGVGLSLDAFLPPAPPSIEPKDSSQPNTELPMREEDIDTPSQPIAGSIGEAMPVDLLSDDDEDDANLMAESDEQATTLRDPIEPMVSGVAIPPPPRGPDSPLPKSVAVLANGGVPQSIELQMPANAKTNFQLQRDDGDVWQILPQPNADPIARILANDDNELQFEWLDAARKLTTASTLTAGRLRTSNGDVVYLRPRLDTDPIKLTLTKRDLKLKWNLQGSVPPKVTEIRVSVITPKDVQWQWIEPLETSSPRSTRGVAMMNLKTSEATAVVVRMDAKTTNSLSLRLRFGARLAPTMPWQWTDAKSIRESFEAVTRQLETADAQLLKLDVVISQAKRMRARRQEYLLEEQRDRIDEAVSGWTVLAKRLAELDQLIAFLEAGAALSPELIVKWDDAEQVILGTRDEDTIE